MGLGPVNFSHLAGICSLVAAAAGSSRGGPGRPQITTVEDWKVSIRKVISGNSMPPIFGMIDMWVYFHPQKGNVLGVSIGDNRVPGGALPNVVGLAKAHYHPANHLLTVETGLQVYKEGVVAPVDLGKQSGTFSPQVLKILRSINQVRLY